MRDIKQPQSTLPNFGAPGGIKRDEWQLKVNYYNCAAICASPTIPVHNFTVDLP